MKGSIRCGMEANWKIHPAKHMKGYCSCYGTEAEEYLTKIHQAEGSPIGKGHNGCGCGSQRSGDKHSHCVAEP